MAWWQRLIGRERAARVDPQRFPLQFELLPGRLTARVHLHDIPSLQGPVPCWTYVTRGLSTHKQKELIFSLRRNPGEAAGDVPPAPLDYFVDVYRFAEQGKLVDVGAVTEFAAPTFLGRKGLMYIEPLAIQDVEDLDLGEALAVVLLTEEELAARKAFGPTRVIARLGNAARYYPCPPWSDRARRSLPFASALEHSILNRVPRAWMRGVRVRQQDDRVLLRLLPQVGPKVDEYLKQIPANLAVALLTELDPGADGCFVWEPGQTVPFAITPQDSDGSRLGGCFMLFVPEQTEERGKPVEDGLAMLLTDASWAAVRHAVAAGESLSIPPTTDGLGFSLQWIETSYHNPVDGLAYRSDDGWETYKPRSPAGANAGPVEVERIVLLTSERDFGARVNTKVFAGYAQAIEEATREHFVLLVPSDGQDLVAQFRVWPEGRVDLRMASRPGITDTIVQELTESLRALRAPPVSRAAIEFQIVFKIWGGSR